MASIGLSEAARLTGRNQSTIHRAMKAGRLSYTVDETGERRIDTSELARVFPIKPSSLTQFNGASVDAMAQPVQSQGAQGGEGERVIAAQRETIVLQDATIRDLRARLDAAETERRQLSERLAGLLERRTAGSVPVTPVPTVAPVARGWWKRLFGV